jgi:hypothetical protein
LSAPWVKIVIGGAPLLLPSLVLVLVPVPVPVPSLVLVLVLVPVLVPVPVPVLVPVLVLVLCPAGPEAHDVVAAQTMIPLTMAARRGRPGWCDANPMCDLRDRCPVRKQADSRCPV